METDLDNDHDVNDIKHRRLEQLQKIAEVTSTDCKDGIIFQIILTTLRLIRVLEDQLQNEQPLKRLDAAGCKYNSETSRFITFYWHQYQKRVPLTTSIAWPWSLMIAPEKYLVFPGLCDLKTFDQIGTNASWSPSRINAVKNKNNRLRISLSRFARLV